MIKVKWCKINIFWLLTTLMIKWIREKLGLNQLREEVQKLNKEFSNWKMMAEDLRTAHMDLSSDMEKIEHKLDRISENIRKIPKEMVIKNVLSI